MLLFLFSFFSLSSLVFSLLFFFNDPPTTEIYTLSLHDALPIFMAFPDHASMKSFVPLYQGKPASIERSEEHTSELQSHSDLVCRLLLEKKKKKKIRRVLPRLQYEDSRRSAPMQEAASVGTACIP